MTYFIFCFVEILIPLYLCSSDVFCQCIQTARNIYKIYTIFISINAPSLLVAPPPALPLQSSYFGVLHPSQQPAPLRFRDSKKRCVLVLPQSNTAYEKIRKSQQDKAIMVTNASAKIRDTLYNFFKFKVCFLYFKLFRHYTCWLARSRL